MDVRAAANAENEVTVESDDRSTCCRLNWSQRVGDCTENRGSIRD